MWSQIHHADCINFTQKLLDEKVKFDLILTDPPYNIGKDFGNNSDSKPLKTYLEDMELILGRCKDLLTDDGAIVWFCAHRYVGQILNIMHNTGLRYQRMLIWYYLNGMSRQRRTPVTEYEPILWFTKSENFTYNTDDMRIPYRSERVKNPCYKKDSKGVKRAWMPNPLGALRGDVWKYPVLSGKLYEAERTEHPTQKPEVLIRDLLRAFCPKKDNVYVGNVFDPFMGSGTTAVCCKELGIPWMGCELEEKWISIANERLK